MASLHSSLFRRRGTLAVALIAVAFGGYLGWTNVQKSEAGAAVPGKTIGSDNLSAIPVTVAQVKTADFPVYLHGFCTVQPWQDRPVKFARIFAAHSPIMVPKQRCMNR